MDLDTPWGDATAVHAVLPGADVYVVRTSQGGGGVLVNVDLALVQLTPAARARGFRYGRFLAYARDDIWACVAYERPEWFVDIPILGDAPATDPDQVRRLALTCLNRSGADYLHRSPARDDEFTCGSCGGRFLERDAHDCGVCYSARARLRT